MNKLVILPVIGLLLLLTASAEAQTTAAQPKSYTINFLEEGSSTALASYQGTVKVSPFWRFYRWDNKARNSATLTHRLSKRCTMVLNIYSDTGDDYSSESPDPLFFPNFVLALPDDDRGLFYGELANAATNAGGLNLLPQGSWSTTVGQTLSGQIVYRAAGGYTAADKLEDSHYFALGLRADLGPNAFGKCSNKQIAKFRSSLPYLIKTVQVK